MKLLHSINSEKLAKMQNGNGFIAALDQSGGSTPKALKGYGIDESYYTINGVKDENKMFDLIHQMRTRIIKSPAFNGDKILGAILFEQTMERKIDDLYTSEYLWEKKNVITFLKCDKGLDIEKNGVQLMKNIPNLDETLEKAVKYGVFGTKMRSVINHYNEKGIKDVVDQQFKIGLQIASHGLVPIIEPETTITSEDREKSEILLHDLIKEHLNNLDDNIKVILKVSIPVNPHLYDDILLDKHVVRIVALSGGFSQEIANEKLKHIKGLIASFSRALLENLTYQQSEAEFDNTISNSINKIYDASVNKQL